MKYDEKAEYDAEHDAGDVAVANCPPPVDLQPDYKWLIKHGPAPYQNDPQNTKSYFAELQNEHGEIETLWGVDIERSLEAADVKIDDAISLTRNGHRMVEINQKQPDGSWIKKEVERANWDTKFQPLAVEKKQVPAQAVAPAPIAAAPGHSAASSGQVDDGRFVVMAPYWVDGLHNAEGIELARKINIEIKARGLAEDRDAVAKLMTIQAKAAKLGLGVVPEAQYLNDPELKRNPGEPVSLLGGALVRDKEGAYRPKAGGMPVLLDKGSSLTVKSKSDEAYRGVMELAAAKGWTAIELKGPAKMLANAWMEAKMLRPPLDVVNYKPTAKEQEKLAEKLAARVTEESSAKSKAGAPAQAQEAAFDVSPAPIAAGLHIGAIVEINRDRMAQKIGRDPNKVVWHDISKLSRVPELNEMTEIQYENGIGQVKSNEQSLAR